MIRQFYLENEFGELYYFNHKNQTLISHVSGLGFSFESTYFEYSRFYSKSDYNIPLSEIKATLIFLNGYDGYKGFVDYISKSNKELKLHYLNDAFTAYCYIDIKSLSKTELIANSIQSEIIIKKLSLWLKERTYEIVANGTAVGKSYPYTYPFSYTHSFEGKINVDNLGLDEAPLVIEIEGDFVDPELIISKNGEKVSQLRLFINKESSKITVNSIPSKQEITLTDGNVKSDIYSAQDFEEDNFIFLDHGNYEIEFKPGVATTSICRVTVLEGYLGI